MASIRSRSFQTGFDMDRFHLSGLYILFSFAGMVQPEH